jgi:hypothetical protein
MTLSIILQECKSRLFSSYEHYIDPCSLLFFSYLSSVCCLTPSFTLLLNRTDWHGLIKMAPHMLFLYLCVILNSNIITWAISIALIYISSLSSIISPSQAAAAHITNECMGECGQSPCAGFTAWRDVQSTYWSRAGGKSSSRGSIQELDLWLT